MGSGDAPTNAVWPLRAGGRTRYTTLVHTVLARIEYLLRLQRRSRRWLALAIGRPPSTVHSWFARDTQPRGEDLARIAEALHTTSDYLATGEEPDGLLHDPAVQSIVEMLRPLTPDQRGEIRTIVAYHVAIMAPTGAEVAETAPSEETSAG